MTCTKCSYRDRREVKKFGESLCKICAVFAPESEVDLKKYVSEKIDWKSIDTFRQTGQMPGIRQKKGMSKKAEKGSIVTRSPMGYDVVEGRLVPNEDSAKIHSLFKVFLKKDYSLNSLSKNYGLSVNGLKKVLKNRTYLGEIKFDGRLHKADHKAIISSEIFYAVQRKLETYLRPRGKESNKYALKGEKEPLRTEKKNTDRFIKKDTNKDNKQAEKPKDSGLYKSIFDE